MVISIFSMALIPKPVIAAKTAYLFKVVISVGTNIYFQFENIIKTR